MNVLALYDIHGNIDALEAVLADPRAASPTSCSSAATPSRARSRAATLDRLAALDAPRWMRGNGEREVAEAVGARSPPADDSAAVTAAISAAELGDERGARARRLPLTLELDGVLYCHATPAPTTRSSPALSPPERWAAALGGVDGARRRRRPHAPAGRREVGDVRFVNAGSVGLPYEGDGAARWLWVADGVPELRRTEYDAAAAGRRMLGPAGPTSGRSARR